MQGAGAPLYDTLTALFPAGLFSEGLEATIKHRVRRRLRDIGYRVVFPPGEPWEGVVELFAIAGLERMHRGYGENPWFWVVAWPSVFGAAAVDFWPEVGTSEERRLIAAEAASAHLEAILIRVALSDSDAVGALPASAIKGLSAIGQRTLPAIPTAGKDGVVLTAPRCTGFSATPLFSKNHALRSDQQAAPAQIAPALAALAAPADPWATWSPPSLQGASKTTAPVPVPPQTEAAPPAPEARQVASRASQPDLACPVCGKAAAWMSAVAEAYGEGHCAACDQCQELCGTDAPPNAIRPARFLHCAACRHDLCEVCATSSRP